MMGTSFESLRIREEEEGRLVVLELDHGRANEMGSRQVGEWEALALELESGEARAVITVGARRTSRGTPVFIAGADVTERAEWSEEEVRAHVRRQRAALARLRAAPVFHVAVVGGLALGWGTEFLLCCDWRIALPEARFGLPETGLGILPGAGGTSELWAEIGVSHALRLGMTGEQIDAADALRIGLVHETAPDLDAALARARAMASAVARRSPTAVAAFKASVLSAVGRDGAERAAIEARAYEHCLESGDAAIGRARFKEITAGGDVPWAPRRPFRP